MLAAVGLGKRIDHYPHQLSGGQRQRVAIARALVRGPKIVLADEPTAALDKASGREVVDLLQKLSKKQGCAILMVTHDNRILDVADRILTLEDGRISSFAAAIGTTAEHQLGAFTQMHRKGELRRHLSDLSDDEFSAALGAVTGEFEQALRAIDLANAEASSTLLNQMLDVAAARISAMLHAERTTVFVIDSTRQELRSKVAQTGDEHPLDIRVPIGVGIAGKVAGGAGAMNIADPQHHPDFNPEVDRRTGYHTRSILAMPITNRAGAIVGVAQVLNKKEQTAFTDTDATTLQRFIPSLGIILETCERLLTAAVTDHS
jgi:putative ABC transport system ATP-binding protein